MWCATAAETSARPMIRPIASSQGAPGLARQQSVKAKTSGFAGLDALLPRAWEGGVVRSATDGWHTHHLSLVQLS